MLILFSKKNILFYKKRKYYLVNTTFLFTDEAVAKIRY